MNIHLSPSFATPLQHILTGQVIPTVTDEVLDELYDMLYERMTNKYYRGKKVDTQAIHNECLSLLNKLIHAGKIGGTALCEVEDIPCDRFLITIHWAAVRTWTTWEQPRKKTTGIKTQKWDATRDFIFTIGDSIR